MAATRRKRQEPWEHIEEAVEATIDQSISRTSVDMHGRDSFRGMALGLVIGRYADHVTGGNGLSMVLEAAASAAEDVNAHSLAADLRAMARSGG